MHISAFNAVAVYPGGTIEILWLKRFNLAEADPRLGHERRYWSVPPGRGAHVLPDWALICSSGTMNHSVFQEGKAGRIAYLADRRELQRGLILRILRWGFGRFLGDGGQCRNEICRKRADSFYDLGT